MRRVCAYCRVSTEQDDQLNSLENQKRYFEEYIRRNGDWEFCGLYVDEGISGTSVERRAGFKRMVADAEAKKFDLLLTKEISRFARNTLDSILYTRKLKELGVGVVFVNDNINTLDNDAELRLTIMSSIAQEESRKTSERVRWGHRRSMEQGVIFGNGILGYDLKGGKLTINEEEAKTVRLIFDLYLSGMGIHLIRKELENRGILSPSGKTSWQGTPITWILRNVKYAGNLKQRLFVTTDYLSHKRKMNKDEGSFITLKNTHEPIVSDEIFDRVQREIRRRTTTNSRHSNRYVWSGKIECANCGSKFGRRYSNRRNNPPREAHFMWMCLKAVKYGKEKINAQGRKVGCNCKAVHEWFLRDNFLTVLNSVIENKDAVAEELKKALSQIIADSPNHTNELNEIKVNIEKITARKNKLVDAYMDNLITKSEFEQVKDRYSKQLSVLVEQLEFLELDNKSIENLQQKMENVETAIENLVRLKEFGEAICSEILHKVVVEGREKISYYLKTNENADTYVKIPVSLQQSPSLV